ncbi:MAG: amidohydrolase, partial [Bacteroidota bacterium]|nr:amidohydrolase [Bacteroidota bacterium]
MRRTPIVFLTAMLLTSACTTKERCDLIVFNGRITTMDDSIRRATAFAVQDGRILAVGSDATIRDGYVSDRVVDLAGKPVYPGFIDAHAHLHGLGEESTILGLHETEDKTEVLELLRARVASVAPGAWIRGRGWDQNRWTDRRFPSTQDLDAITTRHPVFLSRVDGHAVWVNSRALTLARITRQTPDPPGGKILRDQRGDPTGILLDQAIELVRAHIPPPDAEAMARTYRAAVQRCLAVGLVGVHDMGMTATGIEAIRLLITQKAFPFHLVAYVDDSDPDTWESLLKSGRQVVGTTQLVLAGLKLYADGALGSRGALLLEEYADDPGNRGIAIQSGDSIRRETMRALEAGLQVCVHAIGDGAVRTVLDAYEAALDTAPSPRAPLRVEHAQVIAPRDLPRFASLGVVPSMQPTHCTSDMTWAEARLGARRVRSAYAWASLRKSGAWIPAGSDFPVERPDPIAGLYAAIFRMTAEGMPVSQADIDAAFQTDPASPALPARWTNGWFAEQCLSRMDALRGFTIWAARAAGLENERGSIAAGKWADFVVLSEDILTVPRGRFLSTRVLSTWVAGVQVFARTADAE